MKTNPLLLLVFLITSINAQGQKVIDSSLEQRNVNDFLNDTFYYRKHDTIYLAVSYADTKKTKTICFYRFNSKQWCNRYSNGNIKETGIFKRKRYLTVHRSKYRIVIKRGIWDYYDEKGTLTTKMLHQ